MDEISGSSPWASRRKSIFIGVVTLLLASISFFIFWKFWYKTPTCFDGVKNGDEKGVDCGGTCSLICKAEVLAPIVRWDPRIFEIQNGIWSVVVYVENPNLDVKAVYVPYTFSIYGDNNQVVKKVEGATILPKNKTVGIFEGNINIDPSIKPRRVIFEIGDIVWQRGIEENDQLLITHNSLQRLETSPRIEANVKNEGIKDVSNVELVVAVFDGSDNVIATSRTFIENIKKNSSQDVFFTWPRPFDLGSKICETPSATALLLDRSGSMTSQGTNPPEPLTSAKNAAVSFVKQLGKNDKVAVVSFATDAKNPIDSLLTNDFDLVKKSVDSINVESKGTQYTNIYSALNTGLQELLTPRGEMFKSKIMVLLTDGLATKPSDPNGKTESEDIKYAENLALKVASEAKENGVSIYTIGLGKDIKESFLKEVASNPEQYFFAPSASNLETIYQNISSRICKEVPSRIEITYKVFGEQI